MQAFGIPSPRSRKPRGTSNRRREYNLDPQPHPNSGLAPPPNSGPSAPPPLGPQPPPTLSLSAPTFGPSPHPNSGPPPPPESGPSVPPTFGPSLYPTSGPLPHPNSGPSAPQITLGPQPPPNSDPSAPTFSPSPHPNSGPPPPPDSGPSVPPTFGPSLSPNPGPQPRPNFVPPPLEFPAQWMCGQSYKYSTREAPADIWEKCNEIVKGHDEKICDVIKEEITSLMVVAGLLLAVVTAFSVESYKLLQEDKQDTMSDLLVQVVRLLNDTSVSGHASLPKPFTAAHRYVVVNQLWFLSIMLNLVAVMIGSFCLQWISAFLRGTESNNQSASPTDSLAMRQLRYDGIVGWGVRRVPEVLLLIVQLSLALFAIGLIYFLWDISHTAAIPALTTAVIATFLLCLANLMPFLQSFVAVFFPKTLVLPQCPYKSPTSSLFQFTCNSLTRVLHLIPFQKFLRGDHTTVAGRFVEWMENQPGSLISYFWKNHDSMCAHLRESWGACFLQRYAGIGLSSAFDILVLEPDTITTIRHFMKSLASTSTDLTSLSKFFNKDLTETEKQALRPYESNINFSYPDFPLGAGDPNTFVANLRDDFAYAFISQNLAHRSEKVSHILMPHLVELYIRIQNSSHFIRDITTQSTEFNKSNREFASSLSLPVKQEDDIINLDEELKLQFLMCINRLIDKNYAEDDHLWIAATIVRDVLKRASRIFYDGRIVEPQQPNGNVYWGEAHNWQVAVPLKHLCERTKARLAPIPPESFKDTDKYRHIQQLLNDAPLLEIVHLSPDGGIYLERTGNDGSRSRYTAPDGSVYAQYTGDNTFSSLYTAPDGRVYAQHTGDNAFSSLYTAPDGRVYAQHMGDNTLSRVYTAPDGSRFAQHTRNDEYHGISTTPDGNASHV